MLRDYSATWFIMTASLLGGCATWSGTHEKGKTASPRAGKPVERSLAPRLSENYELSSTNIKTDKYIKRRGSKARGTLGL